MANAALFWGLLIGLVNQNNLMEADIPFKFAKMNFYNAAKKGINAKLYWRGGKTRQCADLLIKECIPIAKEGLDQLGIDRGDSIPLLNIIEERAKIKQNGAHWQRAWVKKHGKDMINLSAAYLENQHSGLPVHEWEI